MAVVVVLALVLGYFLPMLVAAARKPPHANSVAIINLFLGWTFIGWVIALAMALRDKPER